MKELAVKILKWLKPELWECYSKDCREDYIADLAMRLKLYIEDNKEYLKGAK